MARKSAATLTKPGIPQPVKPGHYADWPDCLIRYKWLVEEGLRAPDKMFNSPTLPEFGDAHYCKVCGAAYRRSDWLAHVNEHAEALGLNRRVASERPTTYDDVGFRDDVTKIVKVEVNEELKLTIIDSIQGRLEELQLQFSVNYGLLGDKVARAINDVSVDGNASEPPLCAECAE